MKNDYLRIIFYKKLSQYAQNTHLINGTFDELLKLYSSGKRYYHDLTHIINLLKLWEENKNHLADDEVVYLAIWFHDAVYDAWKSNNEELSAELAKEFLLKINFPAAKIDKVVQYIHATKNHENKNNDNDLSFFLDFDLSILGAEEAIYDVYTQQIRDEYSFYPSFIYNRGRKKVLKSFLEKSFIFKTEEFRAKLEAQARENIQRELESL
jgi:predicted metal-dependent HD superfamily phosphohydrolase